MRIMDWSSDVCSSDLSLAARVDHRFEMAVDHVLHSRGRVILCGMGKSGIISHKIAATLMSTGTPSFYMHPGEAYHGDLGMVTPEDTFVAISNSGEKIGRASCRERVCQYV